MQRRTNVTIDSGAHRTTLHNVAGPTHITGLLGCLVATVSTSQLLGPIMSDSGCTWGQL
jgi:hypothetical protein